MWRKAGPELASSVHPLMNIPRSPAVCQGLCWHLTVPRWTSHTSLRPYEAYDQMERDKHMTARGHFRWQKDLPRDPGQLPGCLTHGSINRKSPEHLTAGLTLATGRQCMMVCSLSGTVETRTSDIRDDSRASCRLKSPGQFLWKNWYFSNAAGRLDGQEGEGHSGGEQRRRRVGV